MNYHERKLETLLGSGGKDKQLKLWNIESLLDNQAV
jgi:hypothetical protein